MIQENTVEEANAMGTVIWRSKILTADQPSPVDGTVELYGQRYGTLEACAKELGEDFAKVEQAWVDSIPTADGRNYIIGENCVQSTYLVWHSPSGYAVKLYALLQIKGLL